MIALTSIQKKTKKARYNQQVGILKELERQHKKSQDPEVLPLIKKVSGEKDYILRDETEKRARFLKQTYYESGPKATKLLANDCVNNNLLIQSIR